jgi:DNA-binding PadR family transcriptional regulator
VAPKELLALRLLMDHPKGLYASELVHLSGGKIGRGTVYTMLDRLVDKGFVREQDEAASAELQLQRTRHFITGAGAKTCQAIADELGFMIKHGALAR